MHYLVTIFRFVAIYALFRRLEAKKCLFWDNKSVSWWKKCIITCFFAYIYWAEFANNAFVAPIVTMRLTKILWAILPSPKGYQLLRPCDISNVYQQWQNKASVFNFWTFSIHIQQNDFLKVILLCDCVNSNTYANTHTCVREVPSGWYGGWRKPPYAPIFQGMLPLPPIFLWGQPPQTASVFLSARLRVLLNFFKNIFC